MQIFQPFDLEPKIVYFGSFLDFFHLIQQFFIAFKFYWKLSSFYWMKISNKNQKFVKVTIFIFIDIFCFLFFVKISKVKIETNKNTLDLKHKNYAFICCLRSNFLNSE